jgi:predicted phage terminase large subunit-like protein
MTATLLGTPTLPDDPEEVKALIESLRKSAEEASTEEDARALISRIASITRQFRIAHGIGIPNRPDLQAKELDPGFTSRPHLHHLGTRIAAAVREVERGHNQHMVISMPPRSGKTTLTSIHSPLWMLRRHPEWKIVSASYDGDLTAGWARSIRTTIEERPDLGIALRADGGAGGKWETVEGGGMFSTSIRGSLTGRGARVLIIDDPIKDFVEAHSLLMRQNLWDWWLSVALTRLEPPYLVIVVMTRWHEDDFVGRLLSPEHEGDPRQWEKISLPALAEKDDVLGRSEGQPLLSPIFEETPTKAVERWEDVRRSVGTYTFSAMYQQRPAPAKGAIFDSGWWRFWTMNPDLTTEDGRVVYLDPSALTGGTWLDSWDCAFKSTHPDTGGWVVGQRWVRSVANRYLISQQRGRWSFTQTITAMLQWAITNDPARSRCGHLVHKRIIEEAANGAAVIDTLKEQISGLTPITASIGKVARARICTPEIESGNVYLPHPSDPGNEWVTDLLSELRNFPNDTADDQVDALTQGLLGLRDAGKGGISNPNRMSQNRPQWQQPRDLARAAASDMNRRRGGYGGPSRMPTIPRR